jgi:exodeoxyribonuclease-5
VSDAKHPLFILKGYAGTGKSTLIAYLVNEILARRKKVRILAPTGKAAKVIANYAKQPAYTIHKQIYFVGGEFGGASSLVKAKNLFTNTLFIVDEASMVGIDDAKQSNSLLEDLLTFVYSGEACKLMVVGDPGQLPPVGQTDSPALDKLYLANLFPSLTVYDAVLKEIVRQASSSEITEVATYIRNQHSFSLPLIISNGKEVQQIDGSVLSELLESSYDKHGMEETVLLTMSNKRANQWNNEIRSRILFHEENVQKNDVLMVVKNNYFWLKPESLIGFIANGETIRIKKVHERTSLYGFEFAKVCIEFVDYPDEEEMDILLNLEALNVEAPSLSRDRMKELFFEVEKDYSYERNKKKRYQLILKNRYFNALQVKYSNAITAHKAQGGQWKNVVIDFGYLPEQMRNESYNRWLYTCITRSKEKVYLLNFPADFFKV